MAGRLVIAGTQSGVGKTTITVGLIDALRRRGLTVQPFKVGPDFIDPTYHTLAAGRPCRNLDTWMVPADRVKALFERASRVADFAVIEGVMGLFDGSDYDTEIGSTAEVAKLLEAAVILVLDASKVARSAAAIALGFQRFDRERTIAGFVVNNVASEKHGRGVKTAVEQATGLPVLGWLPREKALRVPERHLGLIPTAEPGLWSEFIRAAGDTVARHVDLTRMLQLSAVGHRPPALPVAANPRTAESRKPTPDSRPLIAVARDEAFHFTYEENLDLLRDEGADIRFFSPLSDERLPDGTSGIILSGGFPEVYAARLSANQDMHAALRAAHECQLPIYAECGGLMYLTESIVDTDGDDHSMVGLLPGRCVMGHRLTLGYRLAQAAGDSWFLPMGETIRGHEFHYSRWEGRPDDLPPAFLLLPRSGEGEPQPEGARVGNLIASYVHVHLGTRPDLAERFVAACRRHAPGTHSWGGRPCARL